MTKFLNISTDTTLGGNAPSDELAVSQKAIKTYVDNHSGGGTVAIDNSTITKNESDEIQAVAVIDQNTGIAKTWTGTQAEYDAIATKDPETEYIITDDIGGPATVIAELAEVLNGKADVSALNAKTAHVVIEYQEPTTANNYTWYRKYADGWVEQGGMATNSASSVTLPVEMFDTNYTVIRTIAEGYSTQSYYPAWVAGYTTRTTTGFTFSVVAPNNIWFVCGIAA